MTNQQGFCVNLSLAIGALTSAKNNLEAMRAAGERIDYTFVALQIIELEDKLNDIAEAAEEDDDSNNDLNDYYATNN